jgi:ketosteroid isomerase-like protein
MQFSSGHRARKEKLAPWLPSFQVSMPIAVIGPFARVGAFMRQNSVATISKEEVQAFYEEFLQALKSGNIASLERIYADDYLLVRPNGDTFGKKEILADLRHHSTRFTSFEVNDVLIRTKGFVGILTATVRSTAVRDGIEIKTHARQLAILSKENERITISHFQSTNVVDR